MSRLYGSQMIDSVHLGIDLTGNAFRGVGITLPNDQMRGFIDQIEASSLVTGRKGKNNTLYFDIGSPALRVSCVSRGKSKFINVNGNYCSYLTGQNQVGESNLDDLISDTFVKLEADLKLYGISMPAAVWPAIKQRKVYIPEIVLTAYSYPIENVSIERLILCISAMLQIPCHIKDKSLLDMSIDKWITDGLDNPNKQRYSKSLLNSMEICRFGPTSMLIRQRMGTHIYRAFTMYLKRREIEAKADTKKTRGKSRENETPIADFDNRLRMEIRLTAEYLRRNSMHTLKDIYNKCSGNYRGLIVNELDKFLAASQIHHLFSFPSLLVLREEKYKREYTRWRSDRPINKEMHDFMVGHGFKPELGFIWYETASNIREFILKSPRLIRMQSMGDHRYFKELKKFLYDGELDEQIKLMQSQVTKVAPDKNVFLYNLHQVGDLTNVRTKLSSRDQERLDALNERSNKKPKAQPKKEVPVISKKKQKIKKKKKHTKTAPVPMLPVVETSPVVKNKRVVPISRGLTLEQCAVLKSYIKRKGGV